MLTIYLFFNCLKNLTLTLEEEISILDKYRLIPNELMFIKVLLILQEDGNENLFKQYIRILKDSGINLRELILTLQNKEIILKSYKIPLQGQPFDPFSIPFNKNFIKSLYKCSFELGKELFESYPITTTINGSIVTLRGVSKHFDSLEDAYYKYGKAIGWNPDRHKYILELLKWAKENNVLSKSLGAFIVDQGWNDLDALRNGDIVNINYDTVKML